MRALLDERFLLLGALGRGASAAVMRAYDAVREQVVALKLLDETTTRRCRHAAADEFEACRRVPHPNVVSAFELGVTRSGPWPRGRPYIVMESVEGPSLDRLRARGPLDATQLRRVAIEMLRVLDLLHQRDLVHRDIKPQNILYTVERPSSIKLTDFGLAVPCGSREPVGSLSGSLRYLAPESILGQPLDGRADLYSLGLTLAYLALGRAPCPGRVERAIQWHLEGASVRLDAGEVGSELAALVEMLTRRDRERRCACALSALERLGEAPSAISQPPSISDERVRLRLDLDATRLGERRTRQLRDAALLREARTWAEVRGVPLVDLRRELPALRELVLREAAEAHEWRPLGRRLGLHWHRSAPLLTPRPDDQIESESLRPLLDQLLQLLCGRGLVLVVGSAQERNWGRLLREKAAATPRSRRDRCGFLLLTHRRW